MTAALIQYQGYFYFMIFVHTEKFNKVAVDKINNIFL